MSRGNWYLPVIGMSTSPGRYTGDTPQWASGSFGYKKPEEKGGHTHAGVDIYAQKGAQIISPVSGRIKSMGSGNISGNYVKVQGDDGNEYYFAHMDSIHTGLSRGMRVNGGDFLGAVGNTGNASRTTTHLHFEVRRSGKSVSPNEFIQSGQSRDTTPLSAIAGLNSVEQLQAYIDEHVRAAAFMNQQSPLGFDLANFDPTQPISEEELQRQQTAKGQSMLGETLNAMSNTLSGGNRTQMARMSSSMNPVEGGVPPPPAEEQRATIQQEEPDARG